MGIYRPTVIVDYDREALTYAPGNVRVTFDRRIRGCHQPQLFFSENLPSIPAISPDRVVMEVKYDDYLPDIVNRTDGENKRTGFFQVCSLPHHVLMGSKKKKIDMKQKYAA